MYFLLDVVVAIAPSAIDSSLFRNFSGTILGVLPNPLHLLHAPTAVLCEKSLGLNSLTDRPHSGHTSLVEKFLSLFSPNILTLPFASSIHRFTLSRMTGSFFLSHIFLSTIMSIS